MALMTITMVHTRQKGMILISFILPHILSRIPLLFFGLLAHLYHQYPFTVHRHIGLSHADRKSVV